MTSMTITATRQPLQTLSMSSSQRGTRRRSARLAFDDEESEPVGKRAKTETNGAPSKSSGKPSGASAQPKKAKSAAYEEIDDGFQFSRTRSKKTRAAQAPKTVSIPEDSVAEPSTAPAPARRKKEPSIASKVSEDTAPKRRRSARLSGDQDQAIKPADPARSRPLKRTKKTPEPQTTPKAPELVSEGDDDNSIEFIGADEPALHVQKKRSPTKIALPFADTPVIKRNKEMRRGGGSQNHRRSSSGLRGRRASSLIENGQSSAVPHSQVQSEDFFKHIDQSLPEPRRMRQLLTWCGSRALLEKPNGEEKDHSAVMAARQIQQELLDDFASKPSLSDWFDREDEAPTTIVKKPNPRNAQILDRLKDLETEIQRLKSEEAAFKSLASSSTTALQPRSSTQTRKKASDDISPALLDDPVQSSILASLTGITLADPTAFPPVSLAPKTAPLELTERLEALSQSLEPTIDIFADGVHKLAQYRQTAERAADRVLSLASEKLQDAEKEIKNRTGTASVGTGDVLRALGGIMNRR